MKKEEIKKLKPAERVAGYLVHMAAVAEVGARLRGKHAEDEDWSAAEEAEWDRVTDALDPKWTLSGSLTPKFWPRSVEANGLCQNHFLICRKSSSENANRAAMLCRWPGMNVPHADENPRSGHRSRCIDRNWLCCWTVLSGILRNASFSVLQFSKRCRPRSRCVFAFRNFQRSRIKKAP
jgi:hypothetical protein